MPKSILRKMEFGGTATLSPSDHPNKMKFRGILVRLDEPSDKAPNGSEGHRILVPADVAKKRLKTLVGMGLNYSGDLNKHSQRHKVGAISKAWIQGKDLYVEGDIWKHDFPEVEQDLKQPGLGMSMELGDVSVENPRADVWTLKDFCFLGATILWKRSAAYHKTQAIAARADERTYRMKTKQKKTTATGSGKSADEQLVKLAASAAADGVVSQLQPTLATLGKAVTNLAARMDAFEINSLAAAGAVPALEASEDDEEEDTTTITAARKKKGETKDDGGDDGDDDEDEDEDGDEDGDDDDDDMESAIDKGDLEEMGPETEDDEDGDDEPGSLNKGTKNKGSKTASEDKVGKNVNQPITGSMYEQAMKLNRKLAKQIAAQGQQIAALTKQLRKTKKQVSAAADAQDRRSIAASSDPMLDNLLAKAGTSVQEIRASGQPLTVGQVDQVLAAGMPDGSPVDKMTFKNRLVQQGLMEQGHVVRS
ncbi:MAG: hypothetical protein KGL39_37315 [Patescibacteria group bacterium]|nr:hypothetical protein [Patescibacteria group bacterium]